MSCLRCCECAVCSCATQSLASRLGYGIIFTAGGFLLYLFSLHGFDKLTDKFPFCIPNTTLVQENCENNPGSVTIFRFSIIFITYFLLLSLIMIRVQNSQDFRFIIQNGCWPLKVLLVVASLISSVFIPIGSFDQAWVYVGMTGSVIFILLVVYVLIHLGHDLTDFFVRKQEEGEGWASITFFGIVITAKVFSIIAAILLLSLYPLCDLNLSLIIFNIVFSYVATLWSLSPCVKDYYGHGGLLQGGILSCLVMFTTWTSISANPDTECNPNHGYFASFYHVFPIISLLIALLMYFYAAYIMTPVYEGAEQPQVETTEAPALARNISTASFGGGHYGLKKVHSRADSSISEVFRIKAGVGSRMHVFPDSFSATTLDFKHAGHLKKFEPRGPAGAASEIFQTRIGVSRQGDDEKEHVAYFWSLPHFVCWAGTAFLLMSYTYWTPGNGHTKKDVLDALAMWFKAATSILINIFFILTMYLPSMYGYVLEEA